MKIILVYSSTSKNILNLYKNFLKNLFNSCNLKYLIVNSPTKQKIKTFLKSPHVNKRAKENFELSIYKFKLHTSLNLFFVKRFRYNVPKNIHLKITYSN
jgi:ribosomal protein S10